VLQAELRERIRLYSSHYMTAYSNGRDRILLSGRTVTMAVRHFSAAASKWFTDSTWAWVVLFVPMAVLSALVTLVSAVAAWWILATGNTVSDHSLLFTFVGPRFFAAKAAIIAMLIVVTVWDPDDWLTTARRSGFIFIGALFLLVGLFACTDLEASRQASTGAYQCFVTNGTGSSGSLSVIDAMYFTIGTLTTAGTGSLQPVSEFCREMVAWQTGIGSVVILFGIGGVLWRIMQHPGIVRRDSEAYETALPFAYIRQGDLARDAGQREQAEHLYRHALVAFDALVLGRPDARDPVGEMMSVYERLQNVLFELGDDGEAERLSRDAVGLLENRVRGDRSDLDAWRHLVGARVQLGKVLQRTDIAAAEAAFRQAFDTADELVKAKRSNTTDQLNLAMCLSYLTDIMLRREQTPKAERYAREALKIALALATAGPSSVVNEHNLGAAYYQLGMVMEQRGKTKQAKYYYRKALKVWNAVLASNSPELASVSARLAALG
jgi:tetratricopeptide (TPR) repeat protein